MVKLLFDVDPNDERKDYKHVVKFYFEEDFPMLKDPWFKKTREMGQWIDDNMPDRGAVITDTMILNEDARQPPAYDDYTRLIEYGFLNRDDALIFKLTWAGI